MRLVVAKVLCLLAAWLLVLAASLLPLKILQADSDKTPCSRKLLTLCNAFGGGIFLATCFNILLPAVREQLAEVLKQANIPMDYPLAETLVMLGFFLPLFVEQLLLSLQKKKPSFIALESFSAGSDVGSDSEGDSPFVSPQPQGLQQHSLHLLGLLLALCTHSVCQGLALGLQEEEGKVLSLFLGIAIQETLLAVVLGISMAKNSVALKDGAKVAVILSLMSPLGISIGMGMESRQPAASSIISLLLQGLTGGTFLFLTFFEVLAKELQEKQDHLLKLLCLLLGYTALAGLAL
ncbi:S39A3 protein, partial [Bucco capensis]|nr:S39A3 protein [Bucco capensis]